MNLSSRLAVRVTAGLMVTAFAIIGIALAALYLTIVHLPIEGVRDRVLQETNSFAAIHDRQGRAALVQALHRRRDAPQQERVFDALIDPQGRAVTANLPTWPSRRSGEWTRIEADLYPDAIEEDHKALSRDMQLVDGSRLIVGRDIETYEDREEVIGDTLLWTLLTALVLGIPGGLLISRAIAIRLNSITRTAKQVMEGNLGGRIPVAGTGDDFDRLAATLNSMLDRIEELVASLSRVSDHVAHELRTPLARLQASLQQAAQEDGDVRALLASSLAEAERLQAIFDALLRIARLETGGHRLEQDDVSLETLAQDLADFYRPAIEDRSLSLICELEPVSIAGDRNLLFQAAANLLDNALKYAPSGGRILVRTEQRDLAGVLSVTNDGRAIPPADLNRLTERFYRGSSSGGTPGFGLGLSLAEAIAEAHGGALALESSGTSFTASLVLGRADANNRT